MITIATAVLALAVGGCASDDPGQPGPQPTVDPAVRDMAVSVAVSLVASELIALERAGYIPSEGASFAHDTVAYGRAACSILADPALTPLEKQTALATDAEMFETREAFDAGWQALAVDLQPSTLLIMSPAIEAARAGVRIALAHEVAPELWSPACAQVETLALHFNVPPPAPPPEPAPVPELKPAPLGPGLGGPGEPAA